MKDRLRKVQFKYLDYLFENTYGVKSKFYPNSTFFKKDDKVILELEKSGTLWVLYSVWNSISDTFSIQYEETQQLIKEWMEKQLNSGEVTPDCNFNTNIIRVQEELKQVVVTPKFLNQLQLRLVESQLKNDVVVPKKLTLYAAQHMGKKIKSEEVEPSVGGKLYVSALMEEQLKSAEVTPLDAGSNYLPFMEKQLKQEKITPQEAIPRQIWRDLEKEEVTPRSAIAPPFRWRNLDSVKYAEIKPNVPLSTYHLKVVEEQLKSEEIKPRQVVNGSFDWIHKQVILEEMIPTSFFVKKKINKNEKK